MATAIEIKPGMVLPNGTTVVAASMRNVHQWIILAMRTDTDRPEYATWKCLRPTSDASETVHGHYFDSLREAVDDYYTRP